MIVGKLADGTEYGFKFWGSRAPPPEREEFMSRTCMSLKPGEQVVFNIYSDIYQEKIPMNGNVVFVNENTKTICVLWLEGYKDRSEIIPFEDMLAVYNPNGEMMKFGNITGRSDLLVPGDVVTRSENLQAPTM